MDSQSRGVFTFQAADCLRVNFLQLFPVQATRGGQLGWATSGKFGQAQVLPRHISCERLAVLLKNLPHRPRIMQWKGKKGDKIKSSRSQVAEKEGDGNTNWGTNEE